MGRKAKSEGNGDGSSSDRAEQQYMDGMAPPRIKEIDELALKYRDVRDRRMNLTSEEEKLQKELAELLKQHELRTYRIPDTDPPLVAKIVVVEEKAKVLKWDPKRDGAAEPPPGAPAGEPEETVQLSEEERAEVDEAIDQVAAGSAE